MPLIQTAGDLVNFALRTANINGVGQTPSAEDSNTGLQLLANILAEWQRRRWLVWSLTETAVVSTGATSYTIGAGQAFNVARPDRIDSAFVRWLTTSLPLDAPLGIVEAREDYNAIALKSMGSFPRVLWYESAFPVGVLHFWPIPAAASYELHVFTKAQLPAITALTTVLNLPPEYMSAITYTLAVECCINWGADPHPAIVAKMEEAINNIRTANTQIPTLGMPAGLPGRGSGSVSADVNINFQTGSW
jgi:hypothetical protein